jgi:chromosome segregation ATPase
MTDEQSENAQYAQLLVQSGETKAIMERVEKSIDKIGGDISKVAERVTRLEVVNEGQNGRLDNLEKSDVLAKEERAMAKTERDLINKEIGKIKERIAYFAGGAAIIGALFGGVLGTFLPKMMGY